MIAPAHTGVSPDATHALLVRALETVLRWKNDDTVYGARRSPQEIRDRFLHDLPAEPVPLPVLLDEFVADVLPLCKNEASPRFMGFGDTGDDPAALVGAILSGFTQQNLINQSFDAPSATFTEIAVLRWLRGLIGYPNLPPEQVTDVWKVGAVATGGGTASNAIAMMLARENAVPGCMTAGITDPTRFGVIVPAGIGHYSVRAALPWIGCGNQTIEVPTDRMRYDQDALADALRQHAGRVMAVVAYAGDSRTQTVEHLRAVHDIVRGADPRIWLHADACWGLMCALTDQLRYRLDGITGFDSVTVDPHKVLAIPYSLSALLVRDPDTLRMISSYSDLIMQEDFAFGQVTPFIGSKPWSSLKLWMMMRSHGRDGLATLIDRRLETTARFAAEVDARPQLLRVTDPQMTAVVFLYLPAGFDRADPDLDHLAEVNKALHDLILERGQWHLHQFTLPDPGIIQRGAILHPLRFNGINPRIEDRHITGVLDHVIELGAEVEAKHRRSVAAVTPVTESFTSAGRLLDLVDDPLFAIAYGSHAAGRNRPGSDLDLLYVGRTAVTPETLQQLTDQVVALHQRLGLSLDTEVGYTVKLHATCGEVADAIALAGFLYNRDSQTLAITTVSADPAYLNSPGFKARLLLNAISGPHLFLAGNATSYRAYRRAAEHAVLTLAVTLTGPADVLDIDKAVQALITDPATGAGGEDFLGYDPVDAAWLYGMLNQVACDLAADGLLPRDDTGRYRTDPATRARLTRHILDHRVQA